MPSLQQLGWRPHFQQQLSLDEWEHTLPVRVFSYQRSHFSVVGENGEQTLPITASTPPMTVGDWVLLDEQNRFLRLLERLSLFQRKSAGTKVATQLIAANVNTVFIVSSLNQDLNLNRIERYLTLAHEAQVEPVVVLTKADLCEDVQICSDRVQDLNTQLMVIVVNALERNSVVQLLPWCGEGETVALLGSSGVGKSTLVNTLLNSDVQYTHSIREDDAKGRHTTTSRSLHLTARGALLLDTPGMRELQLSVSEEGVHSAFSDIAELSSACKFADCQHSSEPGCAVLAAVKMGHLDERRLKNYHKLLREQAMNSATLAELRARDRKLSKLYRSVQSAHDKRRPD